MAKAMAAKPMRMHGGNRPPNAPILTTAAPQFYANETFNRLKIRHAHAMVRRFVVTRIDEGPPMMKTLPDQLAQYASYHRDRRNIATHFVGIPMIVLALAILLSRPQWHIATLPFGVSPALVLFFCAAVYYVVLDAALGLLMALVSAVCLIVGAVLAQASTVAWVGSGAALFIVGWVFQFVGHVAYEHRKPAFADDLIGLLIGPLFVLAEILFGFGWRGALRDSVDRKASALRDSQHDRHQPI
jgi:uncharacterized membrane protein YGL010W